MTHEKRPVIGITIGDVAGIGPEIIAKSLAEEIVYRKCRPLVIGDVNAVRRAVSLTQVDLAVKPINKPEDAEYKHGQIDVLEVAPVSLEQIPFGQVSAAAGHASVAQSKEAIRLAMAGQIDAITSGPVNKEAMRAAGYHYEGQTQLFAEETGSRRWGMLLILGNIRTYMLTNHMSLLDACQKVKKDRILSALELIDDSLSLFAPGRKPVIAVSALNPHSGENGLFGREEIDDIIPAIDEANTRLKAKVVGPIPVDTVFVRAKKGEFDAVVSLTHDHANMAMKLIGFGEVITYLLGLPIIRTSVGHGTAFDIAGRNLADHRNFMAAVLTAAELAITKGKEKAM